MHWSGFIINQTRSKVIVAMTNHVKTEIKRRSTLVTQINLRNNSTRTIITEMKILTFKNNHYMTVQDFLIILV